MRSLMIGTITLMALVVAPAGADDLDRLERLPYQQRHAVVDRILHDHPTNPLVRGDTLTLLYRGPARDVRLAGDHTAWKPSLPFHHVPGTDLWLLRQAHPADARLDYKLVIDGQWILDPRNPFTCDGGFGPNSELRGAGYRSPAWVGAAETVPCRLDTLRISSPRLGNERTVVVAVPGGPADGRRPFLLVHDGLEFLTLGGLQDYLDAAGATDLGPGLPICVCVPPVQRTAEYAEHLQADFVEFIIETLMPFIEARYADIGAVSSPWGSLGASYGGRITLELARRHPERFDRLAPMSPSIARPQHDGFAALAPDAHRLYLNWGTHDIPRLIPDCERFVAMLADRGFDHQVDVLPQGHSWGLWRHTLSSAFEFLYPSRSPTR